MKKRIIISCQKADEIVSGLNYLKMSRVPWVEELEEGDILELTANQSDGHYHPVTDYTYKITMIEPIDDIYVNVYIEAIK